MNSNDILITVYIYTYINDEINNSYLFYTRAPNKFDRKMFKRSAEKWKIYYIFEMFNCIDICVKRKCPLECTRWSKICSYIWRFWPIILNWFKYWSLKCQINIENLPISSLFCQLNPSKMVLNREKKIIVRGKIVCCDIYSRFVLFVVVVIIIIYLW